MEKDNQKVIRISRKKLVITLIILLILGWGLFRLLNNTFSVARMKAPSAGMGESGMISPDRGYYPDYYNQQSDITDTREFLKTSYSSTVKTRDVSEIVKEVKNAVRDVEGRIDRLDSSERYGYVSFVVPKSRFEEFRSEIEGLVHEKLYTESISSQNLLSQKQSLEERTAAIVASLVELEKQKKTLADNHAASVSRINRDLTNTQNQLAEVRGQIFSSDDQAGITYLRNQETALVQAEISLRQSLTRENQSYTNQNQLYVDRISQANKNLENVNKEDTNFTNNIETVNGTVNIYWISIWNLIREFSPINPWILVILIVIFGRRWLVRRGYMSRIELV